MTQIKSIDAEDALDYIHINECFLIDVRSAEEFSQGAIEGAVNIPLFELHLRADEIPMDREIVVYCTHGVRSGKAAHLLLGDGFTKVGHISGGLDEMDLF